MRSLRSSALVLGVALVLAPAIGGCSKAKPADGAAAKAADVPVMSIDEVAVRLASGTCRVVDANGAQLRKDVGVIPNAVLLSDYESYSLKELPEDKTTPLVFYCANEQCDASHVAARRARSAGYERVHVLAVGILGWAKAGRSVDKSAIL